MTDTHADLSAADRLRAEASDANLAGIVAGRLAVARALLAPPGPKANLVAAWAPYLHPDRPALAARDTSGTILVQVAPHDPNTDPAPAGSLFLNQTTGDLFQAQEGTTP